MFQGPHALKNLNYQPFPFAVDDLTGVLLTHAHTDHAGLLPKLTRHGYRGSIWTTEGTRDLLTWMLPDSAHIQEIEVEQLNRRQQRRGREGVTPIYSTEDAEQCLRQIKVTNYDEWLQIGPDIKARWWNAGHILGSASIELKITTANSKQQNIGMLFSGDIGPQNSTLQMPAEAPSAVDYLLVESTYGDRARGHVDKTGRRQILENEVRKALALGGNLIIPAFAVERSQELISDLSWLMLHGRLSKAPIFLDSPLAVRATEVFEQHLTALDGLEDGANPFRASNLHFVTTTEDSQKLNSVAGGVIIISASGMCDAGRIRHHLKHNLWRSNATVLLVGYQAPGTLGQLLESGASQVSIGGEHITVKAHIRSIDVYSGHADQGDLRSWIKARLPVSRNIFLVHGEEGALHAQRDGIVDMGVAADRLIIPSLDQCYELDRPQGAQLLSDRIVRLSPDKIDEVRQGRDWLNDLAAFNLDLKSHLMTLKNDQARRRAVQELRHLMEKQE